MIDKKEEVKTETEDLDRTLIRLKKIEMGLAPASYKEYR